MKRFLKIRGQAITTVYVCKKQNIYGNSTYTDKNKILICKEQVQIAISQAGERMVFSREC